MPQEKTPLSLKPPSIVSNQSMESGNPNPSEVRPLWLRLKTPNLANIRAGISGESIITRLRLQDGEIWQIQRTQLSESQFVHELQPQLV